MSYEVSSFRFGGTRGHDDWNEFGRRAVVAWSSLLSTIVLLCISRQLCSFMFPGRTRGIVLRYGRPGRQLWLRHSLRAVL
jgi:hypothetical protein